MRILVIISLLSLIGVIRCRPQQTLDDIPVSAQIRAEQRADQKSGNIKETVAMVTKQLMETNLTGGEWDTRTPPKIRRTTKRPAVAEIEEVSHMGVAEAIDVEKFMETTVKEVKQDAPKTTTDSGLSTWILLSGNSPSTKAPISRSTVRFVEKTTKFPKTTTTRKPPTTKSTPKSSPKSTPKVTPKSSPKSTTQKEEMTTEPMETSKTTKLMTKVKASVLAQKNKPTTPKTTPVPTGSTPSGSASSGAPSATQSGSTTPKTTTTTELGPEAKIVDLELLESRETTKKPAKRPAAAAAAAAAAANKKKKNKVRRKKPEEPSTKVKTNSTKVATKEKPIATQFYNYLSREVMPTVGVGLVGLVLTAGLASYFLLPFSPLRRNYVGALDRKDDHAYDTYFSDGELEQDVIGKMIEGGYEYNSMSNSVYQPHNRGSGGYDRGGPYDYGKYDDRISERQKETGYTVDDGRYEKFQSGSPENFVPVTPAVVPEHGPRNFPPETSKETLKEKEATTTEETTRKFVVGSIPEGYTPGAPIGIPEHGPRSLRLRRSVKSSKGKKFLYRKKTPKSIPIASIDELQYDFQRKYSRSIPKGSKPIQASKSFENEVTLFKNDMGVSKTVFGHTKTKREAPKDVRGIPTGLGSTRTKRETPKVVRNVPKEVQNEAIRYKGNGVPKHGPRSLRLKRDAPPTTPSSLNEQDNEVTPSKEKFHKYKLTKYAEMKKNATLTTSTPTETSSEKNGPSTEKNGPSTDKNETVILYEEPPQNIFSFIRNVFEMKLRIGLNFLLNTSENFSKYLRGVQERVEKVMVENRNRYYKKQN